MTAESIALWKAKLTRYEVEDVRDAIAEFISTATREEARGVVLGDIVQLVEAIRTRRLARAREASTLAKVDEWRRVAIQQDAVNSPEAQQFRTLLHKLGARRPMEAR